MKIIYPGSFDPPTRGHMDIIARAAAMFDEVVVAVMMNEEKMGCFDPAARRDWLLSLVRELPNVTVVEEKGLLMDLAVSVGASAILRGLRDAADYAVERPVADAFRAIAGVETLFMQSSPEHGFVSSRMVRELLKFRGPVADLIPPKIVKDVVTLYAQRREGV